MLILFVSPCSICRWESPPKLTGGSAVAHGAAHELGAAAYAIKAARAGAPEGEGEGAGRLECRWQRDQLLEAIEYLCPSWAGGDVREVAAKRGAADFGEGGPDRCILRGVVTGGAAVPGAAPG